MDEELEKTKAKKNYYQLDQQTISLSKDIAMYMLDNASMEVAVVISGYFEKTSWKMSM